MELTELGFSSWYEEQAKNLCRPEQRVARVTVVDHANKEVSNALYSEAMK